MRAQETAFQLIAAMDRGEIVPRFLRSYADEQKRPGRIADAARFRELVQTIRREALLVFGLQIDTIAEQRLRAHKVTGARDFDLVKLFRDEFYAALCRALDYSGENFAEFCRDLEVYRRLKNDAGVSQPNAKTLSSPRGPFVDRCGFVLDSPMLDQARRAAARFEAELKALVSSILQKVFSRRNRI